MVTNHKRISDPDEMKSGHINGSVVGRKCLPYIYAYEFTDNEIEKIFRLF